MFIISNDNLKDSLAGVISQHETFTDEEMEKLLAVFDEVWAVFDKHNLTVDKAFLLVACLSDVLYTLSIHPAMVEEAIKAYLTKEE